MKQLIGISSLLFMLSFISCDPSSPLSTEEMIQLIEQASFVDSTGVDTSLPSDSTDTDWGDTTVVVIPGGGEPTDTTGTEWPDSTGVVIPGGGEPTDTTSTEWPDSTGVVIPGGGGEPTDTTSTGGGIPSDTTGVVIPGDDCYADFQDGPGSSATNLLFYPVMVDASLNYAWDFSDGTTSNLANPSHTFAGTGVYNVCLVITTPDGTSCSYCAPIYVYSDGGEPWDSTGVTWPDSTGLAAPNTLKF